MEAELFSQAMARISGHVEAGRHHNGLREARVLKDLILAGDKVDPMQLGWARFYEFKCLYELRQFREAFDLLRSTEKVPFAVPTKNAAWMFSVGAECATHLRLPDDIAKCGAKCVELRMECEDLAGALTAATTACALLDRAGRPDMNERFARFLMEKGREKNEIGALFEGYERALDNIGKSGGGPLAGEVAERYEELKAVAVGEVDRLRLKTLIERIESAPWLEGARGP